MANDPAKPFQPDKTRNPGKRLETIRVALIVSLMVVFTAGMIGLLINPILTKNGSEILIKIAILLVGNGLLFWILYLYRQYSLNQNRQNMLRAQILQSNQDLMAANERQIEELAHRVDQTEIAMHIAQSISQNLDPDRLLEQAVQLTRERFNLYFAGIFLVDALGQQVVLQAASGEAATDLLSRQFALLIDETSLIGWTILHQKPRISMDGSTGPSLINQTNRPQACSEIDLPLSRRDVILGALTLQSTEKETFHPDDTPIYQGVANLIATSLENARLAQDIQRRLKEMNRLHQKYEEAAWAEAINEPDAFHFTFKTPAAPSDQALARPVQMPMKLHGQTMGTLNLDLGGNELPPEERTLVEAIVDQTALAIENVRLLEESEKKVGYEHLLNDLTARFSRALDIELILRLALQELGRLPQVSEVSVYLKSPESDTSAPLPNADGGQNG